MRPNPSEEELLARLADGSLGEPERVALERRVAHSPELAAKLAEQQRALALVARIDVEAPDRLRERIAGAGERRPQAPRRRNRLGAVVAVAVALVIVALFLDRGQGAPNVRSTVHFALASATLRPPAPSSSGAATLVTAIDGIHFPDWRRHGWTATGARVDTLDGRAVKTVFYSAPHYARVGYSIVGGGGLTVGRTREAVTIDGVRYAVIAFGHDSVLTWRRDGHTCVLASPGVPAGDLVQLARWT